MIGRLKTPHWTAELADDGVWTSTEPDVAAHLNTLYQPLEVSPADGTWGTRAVRGAAAAIGAEVEWPDQPAVASEETVY